MCVCVCVAIYAMNAVHSLVGLRCYSFQTDKWRRSFDKEISHDPRQLLSAHSLPPVCVSQCVCVHAYMFAYAHVVCVS